MSVDEWKVNKGVLLKSGVKTRGATRTSRASSLNSDR